MISCPVCGSDRFLSKAKFDQLELGVCRDCGLAYSEPLVKGGDVGHSDSSETESAFYSGILDGYEQQARIAMEIVPNRLGYWKKLYGAPIKGVLEVGCGTGAYCKAFENQGVSWEGIEVNERMISFCSKKKIPLNKTTLSGEKSNGKFDVVFLSQVLEHVFDPNLFVRDIKSKLTEGGVVHIDVPNHDSLSSLMRKYNPLHKQYGFLQPYHHLIAYNKRSLTCLLERNGFKDILVESYRNDDKTMGQLVLNKNWVTNAMYNVAGLLNKGSLLVATARN